MARQTFSNEPAERAGVVARAVRELTAILGPSAVRADPLSLRLYARDASMIQGSCSVVTLPASASEVAACVAIARRHGLPVVPRGAGSGLAGGATPLGDAVVVATTRMRAIRTISTDDRVAWVEAGVLRGQLETLRRVWPGLKERLRQQLIPLPELKARLHAAGAPVEPEDIGISRERLRESFQQSYYLRRRFTVLDLAARCNMLEPALSRLFGPAGAWPLIRA